MAETAQTDLPAMALDNSELIGNFNPEPIAKEEPSEQLTIPPSAILHQGQQQDTEMADVALSPVAHILPATPTLASNRTTTPTRNTNGHVDVAPMPLKAVAHGAPVRRYLNDKVTGVLLEGMKRLAMEQPEDPLRILGEFLIQKSKELEGI